MSTALRQSYFVFPLPRYMKYKKCNNLSGQVRSREYFSRNFTETLPSIGRQFSIYMTKKISDILNWYERFSGLNEVRIAQNKVIEAGEKLAKMQEQRKFASEALLDVQKKLKEIHAELDNTKRGDDQYVILVTEEHKLLKEERCRQDKFREAESAERDQFNFLTNAVKNSHDKERTQAEKTKYWSIIGSVVGTILGIIGTSINNHFKMKELRDMIRELTKGGIKEQIAAYAQVTDNMNNDALKLKLSSHKSTEGLLNKIDEIHRENVQLKTLIITTCTLYILIQVISKFVS